MGGVAEFANSSPPLISRKFQGIQWNVGEFGEIRQNFSKNLSDPRNRNHKSLAIANHNFEVSSFSRRNRSEIAMLEVFSESQWFFWFAIAVASDLRFEVAAIRVTKAKTQGNSIQFSGVCMAVHMNAMRIPGDLGQRQVFEFGIWV